MPFVPTDLSNLSMWYKADSLGLSDGAAVSSWSDSSGSGNTLTQATGTKQPLCKTNIVGGMPVVRFDGSDDWLGKASTTSLGTDITMFIFIKALSTPALSMISDADNTPRVFQFRYSNSTTASFLYVQAGGGTGQDDEPITPANWNIITGRRTSNTVQCWVNGVSGGSVVSTVGNTGGGLFTLGGYRQNSNFINADVAEFIIYNAALSTTDRQSVEAYLTAKYLGGNVIQARLSGGMQQLSGGIYN